MSEITNEIKSFWDRFIKENPELEYLKKHTINAWSFGNTPEMANDLLRLVLLGKKVATCSLLRAYHDEPNAIPRVGLFSVICDGNNIPKCVVFYTDTFVCSFKDVTEKHAREEGEGDLTLEYWRKVHHDFFSAYGNFSEDENLICERFRVVYQIK